jgi:hypothetical protein
MNVLRFVVDWVLSVVIALGWGMVVAYIVTRTHDFGWALLIVMVIPFGIAKDMAMKKYWS